MSYLITGANGQLGQALQARFPEAAATDHEELDIADYGALRSFNWNKITTIINAAAYTKVDEAESADGMVAAWQANSQGVANLAAIAKENQLTLVHISTDYVFDGSKAEPYTETDPTSPVSNYGRSKVAGELALANAANHYLVRTSWVIGEGGNFVRTMLSLHNREQPIDPAVVDDQRGRPTFTLDLARAIDYLLRNAEPGTYHMSNSGEVISWAEFAKAIYEEAQYPRTVTPTSTEEYFAGKDNIAPRPANSAFDLTKLKETGFENRDWRQALSEYIEQELN